MIRDARRRTAIGIWRPGSRRLQVGTVPGLSGYSAFVPFVRQPTATE